jgi:hypothetical protein
MQPPMGKFRWGAVVLAFVAAPAFLSIAACRSDALDAEDDPVRVPERRPSETSVGPEEDEDATLPGTPPELLADADLPEEDLDAGTDAPDGSCVGKPNGFQPDGSTGSQRCCDAELVRINTATNCGACGIVCPQGRTCGQVRVGEWGCRCSTNASCVAAGYGNGATCYTTGAGSYCNCQCPGNATTCKNVCSGGATCYDISGQNYCSYN